MKAFYNDCFGAVFCFGSFSWLVLAMLARELLLETLTITLKEALEFKRLEAIEAAKSDYYCRRPKFFAGAYCF